MEYKRYTLYERIVNRWEEKDKPYKARDTALQAICSYFRPDLGMEIGEDNDMILLNGDIVEGSGPWFARKAATCFQGNSVSAKLDWFGYGFGDKRLVGVDELDTHCQDAKDHISAVHQAGNFYDIQPEFTLNGWTTGDPLFFLEEDKDSKNIMCIPLHFSTYRLYYDLFNHTKGIIVKDAQWSAADCFDKFCPGTDMQTRLKKAEEIFSTALFSSIRDGLFNNRYTIWRAVFKVNDPIWTGEGDEFKKPLLKKWIDVYFEESREKEKQKKPLLTTGYHSQPYVNWPINKKFHESCSRTPAFEAIYDNIAMQQIFTNYLENSQLKVRPPMAVLQGRRGRDDFSSMGINYYDKNEWNYIARPIDQVKGDVTLDIDVIEKIFKENLRRHFRLDVFQIFTDLAMNKNVEFKVIQLMEIAGEKVTTLLPMMDSHENYLSLVDARVRDIEMRAGRGPFSKLEMENIYEIIRYHLQEDNPRVSMRAEFMGTMRQTQQRQQKLAPIQQGIGVVAELANMMGDENLARFVLKPYETAEKAFIALNFPQELIREYEDYLQLVEDENLRNAQREQFAMAIEALKASKGMDPGNVGQLTGQTA